MNVKTTATPTTYRLTFERIGRMLRGETREFTATSSDDLAEQVWRLARGHLGSKWFDVGIDLESGICLIEGGRFGRATIESAQ